MCDHLRDDPLEQHLVATAYRLEDADQIAKLLCEHWRNCYTSFEVWHGKKLVSKYEWPLTATKVKKWTKKDLKIISAYAIKNKPIKSASIQ